MGASSGRSACCKGVCHRTKVKGNPRDGFYAQGFKRCQVCEVYFDIEGNRCPCCNHLLRVKPRSSHNKRLFYKKLEEKIVEMPVTNLNPIQIRQIEAYQKIEKDISSEKRRM